ncbi:hypothetical protein DM02DRAFT_571133 [Periconia macrospinosa]|uniref:Thioesterase family protein n=1 Tax=Periconia macrospinosa TaxID=97972 RepID=A0A2V1DBM6_9PLEO|nr:hypothetical protein DM02DRAFT_571133 [Periconia macrospinosa]
MSNKLLDQIGLQQQDSHTYTAGYDKEWAIGHVLLGGCAAAILYTAAEKHFSTTIANLQQPDVLTLHIEFFRPCTTVSSTVKVTDLKLGKGSSFIQLDLFQTQNGKELKCCTSLATSTNFAIQIGPSASTQIPFAPALLPSPDLEKVDANRPDDNWIPSMLHGEVLPMLKDLTFLYPVNGQPTPGVIDYWCAFDRPERFSGAHLAVLSDLAPSASDTLLRTEGVFDAHKIYRIMDDVAQKTPGEKAIVRTSLKDAAQAHIWNTTLNLNFQFKRRVSDEMRWTFTRVTTRLLEGGRMDMDLVIHDEELVPVCLARQVMLVIDAGRRFDKSNVGKL